MEQEATTTPQRGPMMTVVHEVWRTAITLANNICVQVSDRLNADDGDTAGASQCIDRIRPYVNISDEMLAEMLAESGATEAVEQAMSHIRMLDQRVGEAYQAGIAYGRRRAAAKCSEIADEEFAAGLPGAAEAAMRCHDEINSVGATS